jgi:uncharacterized protein (TIGR03067 family)
MRRHVVTILVAGLLIGTSPAPKTDAERDGELLRGDWQLISCEDQGVKENYTRSLLVTFDPDGFTAKVDDAVFKGTFKLDPSRTPKSIDLKVTKGLENFPKLKEAELRGIYKLGGDKLKWCSAKVNLKDRPTEFVTRVGDQHVLAVFKRAKP